MPRASTACGASGAVMSAPARRGRPPARVVTDRSASSPTMRCQQWCACRRVTPPGPQVTRMAGHGRKTPVTCDPGLDRGSSTLGSLRAATPHASETEPSGEPIRLLVWRDVSPGTGVRECAERGSRRGRCARAGSRTARERSPDRGSLPRLARVPQGSPVLRDHRARQHHAETGTSFTRREERSAEATQVSGGLPRCRAPRGAGRTPCGGPSVRARSVPIREGGPSRARYSRRLAGPRRLRVGLLRLAQAGSVPARRRRRISSSGSSRPRRPTSSGWPTSPTSRPGRGSCSSLSSSTSGAARSSAGRPRTT